MTTSLANHILIAMPSMQDPNFARAVIYICEHHVQGTVGLIINRPLPSVSMQLVFDQLHIDTAVSQQQQRPLLFGGPLQPERGFVIHRPFGHWHSSLLLQDEVTVTTSNDIIRAIAVNEGPTDSLVTLGFSGWDENQLEQEVMNNAWLVCPYNSALLYEVPFDERWEYAGLTLGVRMNELTAHSGHA